jgi:hypothetical protein
MEERYIAADECSIKIRRAAADAALGVAESLGFLLAIAVALLGHEHWRSWLIGIAAGVATYLFATWRYRREHDRAWGESP